jgi:hypothetical protein
LPRLPPDFQHHGAERIAGQRIGGGAQRGVDIGGAHGHKPPRIEAEFGEPADRQRTGFNFGKILPYPHQRPACRDAPSEASDETGRRSTLPAGCSEHFMHRADSNAALQRRIRLGMPKRNTIGCTGITMRLDALDAAAQGRKRARTCGGHAAAPGNLSRHRLFE